MEDLIGDHSKEVSPLQDALGVGIDWPTYLLEERQGAFKGLGAWSGAELVGYAAFSLQPMAQRSGALVAFNRGFYMSPRFRGHGLVLLEQAETFAKACGATAMMQDMMESHSTDGKRRANLGDILVRKGYAPYARLFMKVL